MKTCTKCGKSQSQDEFHLSTDKKDKKSSHCKTCKKIYAVNLLNRVPNYYRKSNLKKRQGMTPALYQELYDHREGCCWICDTHENKFKKKLSVDHDHSTGKIRGLLCVNCNLGIGSFREDSSRMYAAVYYLNHFKGVEGFI